MYPPYLAYTNSLSNTDLDTWLPTDGRTVPDIPTYFANNAVFNVLDYGGLDQTAIQAAHDACVAAGGGGVYFARGSYSITSDLTFTSEVVAVFDNGAVLTVPDGVAATFLGGVLANRHRIFSNTGTQLIGQHVYAEWWGMIPNLEGTPSSIPLADARQNTFALRKACKSFSDEWAAQVGAYLPFSVSVGSGLYYLANGFTLPTGISLTGAGSGNTLFYRYADNEDPDETLISLVNVGYSMSISSGTITLTPATGITSVAPPCEIADCFFFTEDSSAIFNRASGVQYSRIFFSACNTAIWFAGGDAVVSDCIADQCATGFVLRDCQTLAFTNILCWQSQVDFDIQRNTSDIQITNYKSEFCSVSPIRLSDTGSGAQMIRNVEINGAQILGSTQYETWVAAIDVQSVNGELTVRDTSFRNLPGSCLKQTSGSANQVTLVDCEFNGLASRSSYTQGTTMSGVEGSGLTLTLIAPIFRNLPNTPVTVAGTDESHLSVQSGKCEEGTFTGPVFVLSNSNGSSTTNIVGFDPTGVALVSAPTIPYTGRQVLFRSSPPSTGTYDVGDLVVNQAPAGGEPSGWTCIAAGTPGTWQPVGVVPGTAFFGDVSPTLVPGTNKPVAIFNATLTANRTCALSTVGAWDGCEFEIVRIGLGAFTLNVGSLKAMPASTAAWARVVYSSTSASWVLKGYGTL